MKSLLLLRHAKSSWKDSHLDDHERPLNQRGKNDAPKIGRLLQAENLLPDLILCSSAKRCRKTAEHLIHHSGYRGETRICSDLYEADADRLMHVLGRQDDSLTRILLIAHNPGLEVLLENLTQLYTPLSTASLAHVELPLDAWSSLSTSTPAKLLRTWQPRELAD
jgi:phosphohistidine phosphatase